MKLSQVQRLQRQQVALHLKWFDSRCKSNGKPEEAIAALLAAQAELNRLVDGLVKPVPANTNGGPISGSKA